MELKDALSETGFNQRLGTAHCKIAPITFAREIRRIHTKAEYTYMRIITYKKKV